MQLVRTVNELRMRTAELREDGGKMALVPTMGALHVGHMALVAHAAEVAEHVTASIFVNPTQFGEGEDFEAYPRDEAHDATMLEEAGCDLLWAPQPDEVYPDGYSTTVSVTGVSEGLCGASRPGHFDGVTTVVSKLFNQVQPDIALFGEKDYQQLAIIRRMARDLDFEVEVIGVPTVREADGLALSSRNRYLSEEDRANAVALPNAMGEAASAMVDGTGPSAATMAAKAKLLEAGFAKVDYMELRDADTLQLMDILDRPARLLAAAKMGRTRLIDNIAVDPLEKT